MYPYTQERELSDADIKDIAAYLTAIELPTEMPTFVGTEDALTRLLMVEKVMIIPRAEGDIEAGGNIYQKQCASCHGKAGKGVGYAEAVGLKDRGFLNTSGRWNAVIFSGAP